MNGKIEWYNATVKIARYQCQIKLQGLYENCIKFKGMPVIKNRSSVFTN